MLIMSSPPKSSMAFAIVSLFLLCSWAKAQDIIPTIAPGIYIFGDSTVDSGNYMKGSPPEWNTTFADFMATFLGLPKPPPYISLTKDQKAKTATGINYGFSGVGVLPETQDAYPDQAYWGFNEQVNLFNSTVTNDLPKIFGPKDLATHLAKSIFVVSFAINDYRFNYLPPANRSLSHLPANMFAQTVLNALTSKLTALYELGARKVVVKNLWPLGCSPLYMEGSNCCNETINNMVLPFYTGLPRALKELSVKLPGSTYIHSHDFDFVKRVTSDPGKYGLNNTSMQCIATFPFHCEGYLYYDNIHTTERANYIFAVECLNSTLCSPLNLIELVGKSTGI